jgi:hypothetical protein
MRPLIKIAIAVVACGVLITCNRASPRVTEFQAVTVTHSLSLTDGITPTIASKPAAPAVMTSEQTTFLDRVAQDTWTFQSSDVATSHHLPWSWYSPEMTPTGGDFANPAEIGLYMLSYLAAHDMQKSWSPAWSSVEAEVAATLDQLEAWQSGTQTSQPHGPNAYSNSVFYQWYWVSWTPPVVGASDVDRVVPSIDNALLAASLITIREYAEAKGHPALALQANGILQDMDFSLWYDGDQHRFRLGNTNDPQGGVWADYYSNENRIINFVARALGQLSSAEFQNSLDALVQAPGTYDRGTPGPGDDITVEHVAWDGSYFTYAAPALFIREMNVPFGARTIEPATRGQIAYAQDKGYTAWGLSDCYDTRDGTYVQQGAPPAAMPGSPETRPGLVTPHASGLALITPLASEAITNLQVLSTTFMTLYHPAFGFRDSVMAKPDDPNYGAVSYRFTTLAQEWMFLSIVNAQTGFVWNYFYRDEGVIAAHADMFLKNRVYLPVVRK